MFYCGSCNPLMLLESNPNYTFFPEDYRLSPSYRLQMEGYACNLELMGKLNSIGILKLADPG